MYLTIPSSRSRSCWRSGPCVRLPNGTVYSAEILRTPDELARGMEGRKGFTPGWVMLFVHPKPGFYQYHMAAMTFPLDMVWLDQLGKVLEIHTAQPRSGPRGGRRRSSFIIEANAGWAQANKLKMGDRIIF